MKWLKIAFGFITIVFLRTHPSAEQPAIAKPIEAQTAAQTFVASSKSTDSSSSAQTQQKASFEHKSNQKSEKERTASFRNIADQLNAAVVSRDAAKVLELITQNNSTLFYDALKLAVARGNREIVQSIVANAPYLNQTQRKSLLSIARLEILKANALNDEKHKAETIGKYKSIIRFIMIDLPLITRLKNVRAARALFNGQADELLVWLKQGANPNALIKSTDDNVAHSLLAWAVDLGKLDHARVLAEYGANVNASNGYGVPICILALNPDDPSYLAVLLYYGLNPHMQIEDDKDIAHSLLWWAEDTKKYAHVEVLKDFEKAPIANNSKKLRHTVFGTLPQLQNEKSKSTRLALIDATKS